MTRILFLFLLMVGLASCKSQKTCKQDSTKRDVEITNQEVTQIIDTLSSDYYQGRGFGTEGIEKAAQYIEAFLIQNNIKPYFETYRDSFVVSRKDGYNIIGLIEGVDSMLKNEFVILSAHYDHVGVTRLHKPDSIRNGANDNASGVSAVLNIAKLIKENGLNKRSVIIALFSGEEIGLTGSEHFAKKTKGGDINYYCGVNVDMIGSVLTDKPGKVYLSGENRSNIREVFNKHIGSDEVASSTIKGGFYDIFMLSDNYPLYKYLKIPAHTFCTFDFNNYEHYHKVSDEIENVDLENTSIIIRNIAKGFIGVVNSDEKEIKLSERKGKKKN